MSIRLPKVPLIIAALLAVVATGMYSLAPLISPDLAIAGIGSDLLGIGIFGLAFLVFALSFALATPMEKGEKPPKKAKAAKKDSSAIVMGDFLASTYTEDEELSKREQKLAAKAEKAAEALSQKALKGSSVESKKQAKADVAAEKKASKDEAAAMKKAIKDSKEAERKSKYEDDDAPEIEYISGEEFAPPLTKEQRDELKEEDRTSKQRAKDEVDFSRGAKKQAAVAAKLKAAEDKVLAKQAAAAESLRLAEEKSQAKEAALAAKEQAKLDKKAAKLTVDEVETVEEFSYEHEVIEESVEEVVEEVVEVAPEEAAETQETVVEQVEEEDKYAIFNAPQLGMPSDEDIYSDKTFIIPFSSPITSREGKALQDEMFKRISELNDKVVSLETELATTRRSSN